MFLFVHAVIVVYSTGSSRGEPEGQGIMCSLTPMQLRDFPEFLEEISDEYPGFNPTLDSQVEERRLSSRHNIVAVPQPQSMHLRGKTPRSP